jgi:hypothetical protein
MLNIKKHNAARFVAAALLSAWCTSIVYAVGGDKAMYMGGTLASVKERAEAAA